MTDSKGRNGLYNPLSKAHITEQPCLGGSSDLKLVGASGDGSCLSSTYPTSTSDPPTPSSSSTGPSTSSPTQNNGKPGGPNTVVLALASLGGVLALAIVAAFLFFFFQKRRKRETTNGLYQYRGKRSSRRVSLDLEEPRPVDDARDDQTVSHITPFSGSQAASTDYLREQLQDGDLVPPRSGPPSSTGRSKASQAGSFRQPRYVVHTDVEDTIPEDDGQDVIELPPTYSERRGPRPPSTAAESSLYTDYPSSPSS